MTPDELGARLIEASDRDQGTLLERAAAMPECLAWLLSHASQVLPSTPAAALHAATIAERLALVQKNSHSAAIASRTRAQALRALGKHSAALDAFGAAASFAREIKDGLLEAQVQIGAIDSHTWLGGHTEAASLARRLLATFQHLNSPQDAARVQVNLGNVFYRQDRYHDALRCYEDAAAILAQSGDAVAAATVDFNLANIFSELLESDRALSLFNSSRAAFAAHGLNANVAMCDFNIGVLSHASGQYSAALNAQQRSRAFFADNSMSVEAAKCDADMADVYRMLNLHSEALAAYDGAISVFQDSTLEYERARAELGRSAILAAGGRLNEAGTALTDAEASFRRQKNTVQLANARLLRAYWHMEAGNTQSAQNEARTAAATFSRLRLPAKAAEAKYVDFGIVLAAGEDAVRKMSGVRRTARRHSLGWLESRAEQAIGRYLASQGKTAAALKRFRSSVDALEATRTLVPGEELHTAFISNKLGVYEDTVALLLSRGKPSDVAAALEFVERSKSRLLMEKVQSALSDALPEQENLQRETPAAVARLAELRAQLNRLYSKIHPEDPGSHKRLLGSPGERLEQLEIVEEAYRSALRAAEIESGPGLFSLLRVVTHDQLQSWLGKNEALIEFYVLHGTICAFVLSKSKPVKVVCDLASADEIEHLARRLRYHLKRAGSAPGYVERHSAQFLSGVKLPLARLYDLLLRPLAGLIDVDRITIVPHGMLHGLPFHALYDADQNDYALDRWEISYSPSATMRYMDNLYEHSRDPAREMDDALVMGVPDEGLGQIAVEVAELAAVLPDARVYCGQSATLRKFFEFAGRSRLVHLATHALFRADNPLFSGLRFSDGWLLARDLYSMRLNCELVTLSACRTGQALVESGDEMFGLLRGFLAAGARSVAVSLWPAEDLPTACLMTRFHALMARGKSRTAALRLAQKYVRRTWQHPYQWAAFALFGER